MLSALRVSLNKLGIVGATAPEQVVRRVEELGLVENWSSGARRALVAAHFGYGTGAGAVFGALRRQEWEEDTETSEEHRGEQGGAVSEVAVGAILDILLLGAGYRWSASIQHHGPRTPRALLLVLDHHAVFGAARGVIYWILTLRRASGKPCSRS